MFLSFLNHNEKENFLELANLVARSDNHFAESEKKWIHNIRKELDIHDYQIMNKSFDEIMTELDDSSFISKTSILLDILNLVMADHTYEVEEQRIILGIRKRWNISDEQYKSITFWIKDKAFILQTEKNREISA